MNQHSEVIYREVQRPSPWWFWGLIFPIALLFWYGFIQQILFDIPFGNKPAPNFMLIIVWFIFGVAFPIVTIAFFKLIIEIHHDGIYIRFVPFHMHYRVFSYEDLEDYKIISYSFLDYGGWGIRMNAMGETAYTVRGKQAIKLTLVNQTIVVGTQNPNELKRVLDSFIKAS